MADRDPYIYRIKNILRVVDGDTIDADIDLGFSISLEKRIRLAGIDTPESRTTDLKEKALGLESKEWLKKKVEGAKNILIKTELPDSTEKYGRIIGHLFINNESTSLNDQMIVEGYAWEYDGGTKKKNFAELDSKRKK
jgi:micrococcal nuclease